MSSKTVQLSGVQNGSSMMLLTSFSSGMTPRVIKFQAKNTSFVHVWEYMLMEASFCSMEKALNRLSVSTSTARNAKSRLFMATTALRKMACIVHWVE